MTVTAVIVEITLSLNPLNAELNPIRHLLALVGAPHIVHVSRIRVNADGVLELLTIIWVAESQVSSMNK